MSVRAFFLLILVTCSLCGTSVVAASSDDGSDGSSSGSGDICADTVRGEQKNGNGQDLQAAMRSQLDNLRLKFVLNNEIKQSLESLIANNPTSKILHLVLNLLSDNIARTRKITSQQAREDIENMLRQDLKLLYTVAQNETDNVLRATFRTQMMINQYFRMPRNRSMRRLATSTLFTGKTLGTPIRFSHNPLAAEQFKITFLQLPEIYDQQIRSSRLKDALSTLATLIDEIPEHVRIDSPDVYSRFLDATAMVHAVTSEVFPVLLASIERKTRDPKQIELSARNQRTGDRRIRSVQLGETAFEELTELSAKKIQDAYVLFRYNPGKGEMNILEWVQDNYFKLFLTVRFYKWASRLEIDPALTNLSLDRFDDDVEKSLEELQIYFNSPPEPSTENPS